MTVLKLICILWLTTVLAAGAFADSRPGYGMAPYPIWSELSHFERSAIAGLGRAEAGDADALLALALVASGSRDYATFERAQAEVNTFLKDFDKLWRERDNPVLGGRLLNSHMHERFFARTALTENAPLGYDWDQSRLAGIFETGAYNCISASLLYGVLASALDLKTVGSLLPSHAFIELDAGGRMIAVETTSPHGFDLQHTPESFAERREFYAERGLTPTTYADYVARERVSLATLTARNMLNQHTSGERMNAGDSARLAEISAYIEPQQLLPQQKRLYFYNRELAALAGIEDYSTMARLLDVTYASVLSARARFARSGELSAPITHYLLGGLTAYAELGKVEQSLELAGEALANAGAERAAVEARVVNATGRLLNVLASRAAFDEGLLVLSLMEGHLRNPAAWGELTRWFYRKWAEWHWQREDWAEVVAVHLEYISDGGSQDAELMQGAFNNWLLALTGANDKDAAQAALAQCQQNFGDPVCGKAREVWRQYLKAQKDLS